MRAVKALVARRPKTILGVDSSSQSFAFGCIDDGKLVSYGEIYYEGADVMARLLDAKKKLEAFVKRFKVDYVCTEQTVKVNSIKTMTTLSYFEAIVLVEVMAATGAKPYQLSPLTWQRSIGNPPLTIAEKRDIKNANPGKTAAWLKAEHRRFRKNRTRQWVNETFGVDIESDNVTDAISVAASCWLEMNPGGKLGKAA